LAASLKLHGKPYASVDKESPDERSKHTEKGTGREAILMTLTLDLEVLGNNDGHVLIPTFPGNGQPYDVTLEWTSTTPSGDISLTLPPQNVTNPTSEQATFDIPNAHLKSIAGGSAAVRYTLVQNGAPANRESETTNVIITSLPVVLTAPLVVEANGTLVLDLAQISGSAVTVMIAAWVGQRAGDRVILNWAGTSPVFGTATPFAPVDYTDEYVVQPGGEQDPITFSVPLEHLTPLGGGTLQVSYQVVLKASGVTQNSPITAYQVKAEPVVAFDAPQVREATFSGFDTQWLDYYAVNDHIHIVVPIAQLASNDTVKVFWVGRSTTIKSDILTVGTSPEPLELVISKYEVIDVIGYITTDIYYTVKKQGTSDTYTSNHLKLSVTGQSFTIKPPTINGSNNNLRVWRQDEFNDTTTVRVRAIGLTEWEVEHNQRFGGEQYLNFPIDPVWLAANHGHSVVFDYSLRLNTGDTRWLFSQLLRINPLQ
jgi:hypothetical protein